MRFGITLPQFGPVVAPDMTADFARQVEALGYESLWVGDRVLARSGPAGRIPGTRRKNPCHQGAFADPQFAVGSPAEMADTAEQLLAAYRAG